MCFLSVIEINEGEYNNSNGIDIIQDTINYKYYKNIFYTIDVYDCRVDYSFNNLKDEYQEAKAVPISYTDDNEYTITTCTYSNSSTLPLDKCEYSIHITNEVQSREVYFNFLSCNQNAS